MNLRLCSSHPLSDMNRVPKRASSRSGVRRWSSALILLLLGIIISWRLAQPPPRSAEYRNLVQIDIRSGCYYDAVEHFGLLTLWNGSNTLERAFTRLRLEFRKERAHWRRSNPESTLLRELAVADGLNLARAALSVEDYYTSALLAFLIAEIRDSTEAQSLLKVAKSQISGSHETTRVCGPANTISWYKN